MHHRHIATFTAQVFATADRLGATAPQHLLAEHEKITTLAASIRFLDVPSDVPGAVLAALEAGNGPTTDDGVRDAVIGRMVNDTSNGIEDRLGERAMMFITDNADALLAMFANPFDTAAAVLTTAAERLGDVDLDDTKAIVSKGGDAAQVWADAQAARRCCRPPRPLVTCSPGIRNRG